MEHEPATRRPSAMTARERILAALHRQPVDRLPFVPLIDSYTVMDMPAGIPQDNLVVASRMLGCDLMIRHVPVIVPNREAFHLLHLGRFRDPVTATSELRGTSYSETLNTPIGSLTGVWGFTDRVGWIPHPVKHVVNNHDEMKIFHYAVEHMSAEPEPAAYEMFLQIDGAIGDAGIATATLPNTPLMHLIETVWGLETTYYLLHDYREEVEDILAKLHLSLKRKVEVVAQSPAQVVIQYENTSSTLLSPTIFRRYCLPCINEYADMLAAAGKVFLVHMCGKLHSFVDDLRHGRYAGLADISPAPTGDLPLDEAAKSLAGKVVIGGIDATTFVNGDSEAVRGTIAPLIERIKPLRGVLLGSADTTPRGTPVANFRLIRELVDRVGCYG